MSEHGPRNRQEQRRAEGTGRGCGRWYSVGLGAVLVVLTFGLLVEAKLWRPGVRFGIEENVQIAEAQAWWNGRLDLPERRWDTALVKGRVYSHFPPLFTFLAAIVVPFFQGVPHGFVVLALVAPVLVLSYVLFYRRTGSAVWGAVLAVGLVCGTSLFPVIDKALRGAAPYYVNHLLATIGLLIVLIESFGRQRGWITGAGLIVAALSRQLTAVYAWPLFWLSLRSRCGKERRRRLIGVVGATAGIGLAYGTLNLLKFGSPLDSGYMRIYADRMDDALAVDAKTYGLFSAHYVPRNWYYMNVGPPRVHLIEMDDGTWIFLRPNDVETGIWWTSPLLLWLFVDLRRILLDPRRRVWLGAVVVAIVVLLFFHNTGWEQIGFNRFSLDYIPVLLALVAPRCVASRWRWLSLAMIGWSVVYFRFLI